MNDPQGFYDALADSYHLIFEDWERSIARQGDALAAVLTERWPFPDRRVLDAAVGIGTQALGLALRGFQMIGADLSTRAVARAKREAVRRHVTMTLVAADFRFLPFTSGCADIVIACDNALPHLLSLRAMATAISELRRCVRPGGGVVISMRDYATPPPPGTVELRPYGEREWNGRRVVAEQEWHWEGPTYRLVLRVRPVDGDTRNVVEAATTYFAAPIGDILGLLTDAGLRDVRRLDGPFYQPLLVGTVPVD
jgi:SAM-dependent methyltransferase